MKNTLIFALLFLILFGCKTEDFLLKQFNMISADKYYATDIIPDDAQNIYGLWKLTSTSGGFSGTGFKKDFDYLLLKPNAVFGLLKNDSLIGYGKLVPLENAENADSYIKNSLYCRFDFDSQTLVQLAYDTEKYICLTGNDTLKLTAPCCDRYNTQFIRQHSDLDDATNMGSLKGKISIGPLCPVETVPPQPGCSPTAETYKAYQLSVWNTSKKSRIKDIVPELSSEYQLKLPAGNYWIDYKSSQNKGIGSDNLPIQLTITKTKTTTVDVSIDTGIR